MAGEQARKLMKAISCCDVLLCVPAFRWTARLEQICWSKLYKQLLSGCCSFDRGSIET